MKEIKKENRHHASVKHERPKGIGIISQKKSPGVRELQMDSDDEDQIPKAEQNKQFTLRMQGVKGVDLSDNSESEKSSSDLSDS